MAPKLRFDGAYFTGTVTLPAWAGFGPRGQKSAKPKVLVESEVPWPELDALPEGVDPELTAAQTKAIADLVAQQAGIRDAVLEALFAKYATLRERFLPHLDDPARMPALARPEDLRPLVYPKCLSLHRVEREGHAYFGLILGCTWDDEHGLGAMLHRTRVIDLGGADTAVLAWIAERDARGGASKGAKKKVPVATKAAKKKKKAAR